MLNKAHTLAIKLARSAAAAGTDAERETAAATLAAHCVKHNLTVAAIIAEAAKPDTGETPLGKAARVARTIRAAASKPADAPKREAKPKAAKPAKPTADKPAGNKANDERSALIDAMRADVSKLYASASLAVRSTGKRYPISAYAELLRAPKHATTLDRISVRDESALALIIQRGTKAGSFDPSLLNLDAGIFSRLASVGYIVADGDGFKLSTAAIKHARNALSRAA